MVKLVVNIREAIQVYLETMQDIQLAKDTS